MCGKMGELETQFTLRRNPDHRTFLVRRKKIAEELCESLNVTNASHYFGLAYL